MISICAFICHPCFSFLQQFQAWGYMNEESISKLARDGHMSGMTRHIQKSPLYRYFYSQYIINFEIKNNIQKIIEDGHYIDVNGKKVFVPHYPDYIPPVQDPKIGGDDEKGRVIGDIELQQCMCNQL